MVRKTLRMAQRRRSSEPRMTCPWRATRGRAISLVRPTCRQFEEVSMTAADDPNSLVEAVEDILITAELTHRPSRTPDYVAENRALDALAQEIATHPGGVLQKCDKLVME